MNSLNEFQREGDAILRQLTLALEKALLEFRAPKSAVEPFERRYTKLKKDMDAFAKLTPHAADYVEGFVGLLRKRMDELKRRAESAFRRQGEVEGKYQRGYNELVGKALGQASGQARDQLHRQVEGVMRKLIDQALPGSEVPSHVKQTMGRELTKWVESQDAVEDAYFVVERSVMEVAGYLHDRLTIKGEIEMTRKTLIKDPEVTQEQADTAEKRVGELAKRAAKLDQEIERRIQRSTTQVKGHFDFRPKLVLDPAKRFVKEVELRAGIRITHSDVKVDLGTKLKVLSPLNNDRSYQAEAYLRTTVGNNFSAGVGANANFNSQGQNTDYQVKATLSWRF